MHRPRKAALSILALFAGVSVSAAEYKPGEVIVKYKDGVLRTRSNVNALYDLVGVKNVRRFTGLMRGVEHLTLNDRMTVENAISELQKDDTVEYVQPNYILHALPIQSNEISRVARDAGIPCLFPGIPIPPGCDDSGDEPPFPPSPPTPPHNPGTRPELKPAPADVIPAVKDPDLDRLYGLSKIKATEAWAITRGSKEFIVADIDTGIDYNHDDLSFNVWRNPNPTDKNDVVGFDFVHNDGLPYDDNLHGTHTAGTIGAVGGNGVGISGVSQRVSLMSIKFLTGDGNGTSADAVKSINYAIEHGARVLSNSWGGKADGENQVLHDAVGRAQAKGVLFIAAAGNDSTDNDGSDPSYPASFDNDNVIAVAATDSNDGLAYFSNYGKKKVHLAAPGVNIQSTAPGNQYKSLSGTSMACPHVAGAAALLWSKHPDWDYKKVKQVLLSTVTPVSGLESKVSTGGRLDILKALQTAESME